MSADISSVELTLSLPERIIVHIGDLASRLGWSEHDLTHAAAVLGLWILQSSMDFLATDVDQSLRSYTQQSLSRALTPVALLKMAGIVDDAPADAS